jgi:hypothetical protein
VAKPSLTPLDGKTVKGQRNVWLAGVAGSLWRRGFTESGLRDTLLAINQSMCEPPLDEAEVTKIAKSIAKYPSTTVTSPIEYTAAELVKKDFAEPTWIVPGLILGGITLFAGKPKIGKSFLALAIATAVANGTEVLGTPVEAKGVLYLALEDSQPRLKSRLIALLGKCEPAESLHFVNAWSPLIAGGLG